MSKFYVVVANGTERQTDVDTIEMFSNETDITELYDEFTEELFDNAEEHLGYEPEMFMITEIYTANGDAWDVGYGKEPEFEAGRYEEIEA